MGAFAAVRAAAAGGVGVGGRIVADVVVAVAARAFIEPDAFRINLQPATGARIKAAVGNVEAAGRFIFESGVKPRHAHRAVRHRGAGGVVNGL
jgi:hypothetical protein